MGIRFRKSIRIAPGLRANIGRKSISASVGTRGLWYTSGTAGQRFTVGIPGTGLSFTTSIGRKPATLRLTSAAVALVIVLVLLAGIAQLLRG
jgi:hypothetical protein